MSQNELRRLLADLPNDAALTCRVLGHIDPEQLAGRAREAGYEVTAADLGAFAATAGGAELSDRELEEITGGKGTHHDTGREA